ncbi:hypothetical protein [Massilia alkalitolerans]|uniref:hypothetical protein n=1 Tax=Massilia alkalitolerans TaxID=286638 RepID=UPI000485B68B|nr:hypothetical protein [Massilia alkalitolerans]
MTTPSTAAEEQQVLIDVCVEGWRFARIFERAVLKLPPSESPRHINQARYFLKKVDDGLERFGLHIVNLTGQAYDPGMAVSALNIGDFGADDVLYIEQVVEPVVMGPEGLVRGGTVILAKAP